MVETAPVHSGFLPYLSCPVTNLTLSRHHYVTLFKVEIQLNGSSLLLISNEGIFCSVADFVLQQI